MTNIYPMSQLQNALNTDWYNFRMIYASFINGRHTKNGVFDVIIRRAPDQAPFYFFAGLEQLIQFAHEFVLTEDSIDFICENLAPKARNWEANKEEFRRYLRGLRFTGKIRSVPEGKLLGPNTFPMQYIGNINEARLFETFCLSTVNRQSRVLSKAVRIIDSIRGAGLDTEVIENFSEGDLVFEGGTRRQDGEAALNGARSCYLGGFNATSNVLAAKLFGIPLAGTMAHNWIQEFMEDSVLQKDAELAAFRAWNEAFNAGDYLGDTVDTVHCGIPNAIIAGSEIEERGDTFNSFRIDSGDQSHLSKIAFERFRSVGLNPKIVASSDLDEWAAQNIKLQGGKIGGWLVGTKVQAPDPMGGVFKLVANDSNGRYVPVIKISGNIEKITNPGLKKMTEVFDLNGKISATIISYADEVIISDVDIQLFDPTHTFFKKTLRAGEFTTHEPLVDVYDNGRILYNFPRLTETREFVREQLNTLWPEQRRLLNPAPLHIDLSHKLWLDKQGLLHEAGK